MSGANPAHGVPFGEAVRVWARVAALSFGGPAGQIAVMHRILVDEKKWIGEGRFLHALNYCMLLPGPEAQQLATYIGWLLHGLKGGLVAGILFVLPGAAAIMALSFVYVLFGGLAPVEGLFFGLKAAVLALVAQAVVRVGRRALKGPYALAIAGAAFASLFLFDAPFPAVVAAAALAGFLAARAGLPGFGAGAHGGAAGGLADADSRLGEALPSHARPSWRFAAATGTSLAVLWLAPVAVLLALLGPDNVFSQIAVFFSKLAVVTFGGAYAVLAYVAQEGVETYRWLTPTEMLDGLGLAESTPGPLIMVTQFVGFLGAYRQAEGLPPVIAGLLGGLLTTWVTFVPCFLWIFLGAPFVERLREARALNGALSAITAAVVGVIANLALWFALHLWFAEVGEARLGPLRLEAPRWEAFDPAAAILSLAAGVALIGLRWGVAPVLVASAAAGVAWRLALG